MAQRALPSIPNLDADLLPRPIINFQPNIHEHLKQLGYDNRSGLEFPNGNYGHAVSTIHCDPCNLLQVKLTVQSGTFSDSINT